MSKAEDSIIKDINIKPRNCCCRPELEQGNMSGPVSGEIHTLPFLPLSLFVKETSKKSFSLLGPIILLMVLSGLCLLPAPKEKWCSHFDFPLRFSGNSGMWGQP